MHSFYSRLLSALAVSAVLAYVAGCQQDAIPPAQEAVCNCPAGWTCVSGKCFPPDQPVGEGEDAGQGEGEGAEGEGTPAEGEGVPVEGEGAVEGEGVVEGEGAEGEGVPPMECTTDDNCLMDNGEGACLEHFCQITSCKAGHYDHNRDPHDGCEYKCSPTNGSFEICDTVDNDCDGIIDNSQTLLSDPNNCGTCTHTCSAAANADPACFGGECGFICQAGAYDNNGDPADGCEDDVCQPSNGGLEICDGLDNDCNGRLDEGFDKTLLATCGRICDDCTAKFGPHFNVICREGACAIDGCLEGFADRNGDPLDGCECPESAQGDDICDGLDNDCNPATPDGAKDPLVGGLCQSTLIGPCKPGHQACVAAHIECVPDHPPTAEICDGADNDCDGMVDDSVSNCQPNERCANGACTTEVTCQDLCTTEGSRDCNADKTVVINCFDANGDGCLEWGDLEVCPGGDVCLNAMCVTPCQDACTPAGSQKCNALSTGILTCVDANSDGCVEWGAESPCAPTEICSGGTCIPACLDECSPDGATSCNSNTIILCGNWDADTCLEWKDGQVCVAPQVCSGGVCQTTCADDCTPAGAKSCQPPNNVVTCGNYDADSCLEWGASTACPPGETCLSGACVTTCTDDCTPSGATGCDGNTARTCGNYDADSCLEWGAFIDCAAQGKTCSGGTCVGGAVINGCADGVDEGHHDNGQIYACKGGWDQRGLHLPASDIRCARGAGDDGAKPGGAGCTCQDLCAPGFHVCDSNEDVAAKGGCSFTKEDGFFAAREQSSFYDYLKCGGNTSQNNFFGCGTMGRDTAGDSNCSPLNKLCTNCCQDDGPIKFARDTWTCGSSCVDERSQAAHGTGPGGVLCCKN